jgi:hypothetical protein
LVNGPMGNCTSKLLSNILRGFTRSIVMLVFWLFLLSILLHDPSDIMLNLQLRSGATAT